jgi:hypothetical protein
MENNNQQQEQTPTTPATKVPIEDKIEKWLALLGTVLAVWKAHKK